MEGESVDEKEESERRRYAGIIRVGLVSRVFPHPVRAGDPEVPVDAARNPSESFRTSLDTWCCLCLPAFDYNFYLYINISI